MPKLSKRSVVGILLLTVLLAVIVVNELKIPEVVANEHTQQIEDDPKVIANISGQFYRGNDYVIKFNNPNNEKVRVEGILWDRYEINDDEVVIFDYVKDEYFNIRIGNASDIFTFGHDKRRTPLSMIETEVVRAYKIQADPDVLLNVTNTVNITTGEYEIEGFVSIRENTNKTAENIGVFFNTSSPNEFGEVELELDNTSKTINWENDVGYKAVSLTKIPKSFKWKVKGELPFTLTLGNATEGVLITTGAQITIINNFYKILLDANSGDFDNVYLGGSKTADWNADSQMDSMESGESGGQVFQGGINNAICTIEENTKIIGVIKCKGGHYDSGFENHAGTWKYLIFTQEPIWYEIYDVNTGTNSDNTFLLQENLEYDGNDETDGTHWFKVAGNEADKNPYSGTADYTATSGHYVACSNNSDVCYATVWNSTQVSNGGYFRNIGEAGRSKHINFQNGGTETMIPAVYYLARGLILDGDPNGVTNVERVFSTFFSTTAITNTQGGCRQGVNDTIVGRNQSISTPSNAMATHLTCYQEDNVTSFHAVFNSNTTRFTITDHNWTIGQNTKLLFYNSSSATPTASDLFVAYSYEQGGMVCYNDGGGSAGCPVNGTLANATASTNYTEFVYGATEYFVHMKFDGNDQYITIQDTELSAPATSYPQWSLNNTRIPSPTTYTTAENYGFQVDYDLNMTKVNITTDISGSSTTYTVATTPAVQNSSGTFWINFTTPQTNGSGSYSYYWQGGNFTGDNTTNTWAYIINQGAVSISNSSTNTSIMDQVYTPSCFSNATETSCVLWRENVDVTATENGTANIYGADNSPHNFSVNVSASGNYTNSSTNYFTLTINPRAINVSIASDINITTTYPFTFTPFCSSNHTNYECSLWLNVTGLGNYTNVTATENNTLVDKPVSDYNYIVNITADTTNYTWTVPNITASILSGGSLPTLTPSSNQTLTFPQTVTISCGSNITQNDCTLWLNGTINITFANNTAFSLPAGFHEIRANISQSQNYSASSTLVTNITVNKQPITSNVIPSSNQTVTHPFNVTVGCGTNSTASSCSLWLNNTLNITAINGTAYPLPVGFHEIRANSSEYMNISASSTQVTNITILSAGTLTELFINGTEGNVAYFTNETANLTALLNISQQVYIASNLTGYSTINASTSVTNTTVLGTAGVYNVTAYYLGDQNNTASSVTYYITVTDNEAPQITVHLPTNNSFEYGITSFDTLFNVQDTINTTLLVELYLNGTTIYSNSSYVNYTNTTQTLSNLNGSMYNITIWATDGTLSNSTYVNLTIFHGINVTVKNRHNSTTFGNWTLNITNSTVNTLLRADLWGNQTTVLHSSVTYTDLNNNVNQADGSWTSFSTNIGGDGEIWKNYTISDWNNIAGVEMTFRLRNDDGCTNTLQVLNTSGGFEVIGSWGSTVVSSATNYTWIVNGSFENGFEDRYKQTSNQIEFFWQMGGNASDCEFYEQEIKVYYTSSSNLTRYVSWEQLELLGSSDIFAEVNGYNRSATQNININNSMGLINLTFLVSHFQNFTVLNNDTDGVVSNFNLLFDNGTATKTLTTTNGRIDWGLDYLPFGTDVLINVTSSGYNTTSFYRNITANSVLNETFRLIPASVWIEVYDEQDNSIQIISQITIANSTNSTTWYNQSTFYFNISQIPVGDVTITISNSSYIARNYYTTITPSSAFRLTAYLLQSGSGLYVRFHIRNIQEIPIIGATVTAQKFISGGYVTMEQQVSDSGGTSTLYLDPLITYRIIAERTGYLTSITSVQPTSADYRIYLTSDTEIPFATVFHNITYTFSPFINSLNATNLELVLCSVSSTSNDLSYVGLNITHSNTTNLYYQQSGASNNSVSLGAYLNLSSLNATSITADCYFKRIGYSEYSQERTFYIRHEHSSLPAVFEQADETGFSQFALGMISIILTAVCMAYFSKFSPAGGVLMGLIVLGMFTFYMNWFTDGMFILVSFTIISIMFLRGRF